MNLAADWHNGVRFPGYEQGNIVKVLPLVAVMCMEIACLEAF